MAAIPLVSSASPLPIQEVQETLAKTPLQRHNLPDNAPEDDEVNILSRLRPKTEVFPQTICFTDLPPEIRNRMYSDALPSEGQDLIVASPFYDEAMTLAAQPAITRASRQLRSETLKMFYSTCTFVAYIKDFDFLRLIHWAQCITSSTSQLPKITVHVKLLTRLHCMYELLELVRDWRDLDHSKLHLKIHNCYCRDPPIREEGFDQRDTVVKAILTAEDLRAKGELSEEEMLNKIRQGMRWGTDCAWTGDTCYAHRSVFLHTSEEHRVVGFAEDRIGTFSGMIYCALGRVQEPYYPQGPTASYGGSKMDY